MGAISYITPSECLTLTDRQTYRIGALAAGIERGYGKGVGSREGDYPGLAALPTPPGMTVGQFRVGYITGQLKQGNMPASVDIREMQPILDAGAVLDQWNTAALAVVGTAYSCFQAVPAPPNPANRVVVFYKCGVETPGFPVSRLIIRSGAAAGNILYVFDLEQLVNWTVPEGYFSEPAVIDPNIIYAVQVLCRIATGILARVQLGTFVIEPAGQTTA